MNGCEGITSKATAGALRVDGGLAAFAAGRRDIYTHETLAALYHHRAITRNHQTTTTTETIMTNETVNEMKSQFTWDASTIRQAADGTLTNMEKWPEEFMDAVLHELENRMIAYQTRNVINGNVDAPALFAARAKTINWLKTWWFHPPEPPSKLVVPGRIRRP